MKRIRSWKLVGIASLVVLCASGASGEGEAEDVQQVAEEGEDLSLEPEVIQWGADRPAQEALAVRQELERHERGITAQEISRPSYRLVPFGGPVSAKCSMLRHCVLELGPGEIRSFDALTDRARWEVAFEVYGPEDRLVVTVKPKTCGPDLTTLLTVGTDRRLYQVVLEGPACLEDDTVPRGPSDHVRFYFPDAFSSSNPRYREGRVVPAVREVASVREPEAEPPVPPEALDFDYRWSGKGIDLQGVYDDGTRMYFRLGEAETEVPILLDDEGKRPEVINFRFSGGVLITDRVVKKALLRVGRDKRVKVVYSGDGP